MSTWPAFNSVTLPPVDLDQHTRWSTHANPSDTRGDLSPGFPDSIPVTLCVSEMSHGMPAPKPPACRRRVPNWPD